MVKTQRRPWMLRMAAAAAGLFGGLHRMHLCLIVSAAASFARRPPRRNYVVRHKYYPYWPYRCCSTFSSSGSTDPRRCPIPQVAPFRSSGLRWSTSSSNNNDTNKNEPKKKRKSVTGTIYQAAAGGKDHGTSNHNNHDVTITLFTKEGCTLCDKVIDVLMELYQQDPNYAHTLRAVDITDDDQRQYWDRYKYDIPVLHLNGQFWVKHRLDREEAMAGIQQARGHGQLLEPRPGEPNAAAQERG